MLCRSIRASVCKSSFSTFQSSTRVGSTSSAPKISTPSAARTPANGYARTTANLEILTPAKGSPDQGLFLFNLEYLIVPFKRTVRLHVMDMANLSWHFGHRNVKPIIVRVITCEIKAN